MFYYTINKQVFGVIILTRDKLQENSKEAALERALAEIEKKYGKGAIIKLGEKGAKVDVEVLPSGILPLDIAVGIGGLPRGRVMEIYGPESSGKTTVALHIIAETQKNGGVAAFIDAEHALDPVYAEKLGVNLSELYVSQPDSGEQALQIAEMLITSGSIDVLVIDSVAALVPQAEIEGLMGDAHVGLQARLMSKALRKLTANVHKMRTLVIFINQLREKIGSSYGNPEVTTGGRALKFYSSVRLEVKKAEDLKDGAEKIGSKTKIKVTKNKVAPPFKQIEVDLYYGEGFPKEACLIDLAEQYKVVNKSGAWYSYDETQLGQGRENVRQFLKDNPEVYAKIEVKIKESLRSTRDNVVDFKQAQ